MDKYTFSTVHGDRSFFGNDIINVVQRYFGNLQTWSFCINERTQEIFYN